MFVFLVCFLSLMEDCYSKVMLKVLEEGQQQFLQATFLYDATHFIMEI